MSGHLCTCFSKVDVNMQWLIQSDVHGVSGCPWGLWVFMGHWVSMGSPCVHEVSGFSWGLWMFMGSVGVHGSLGVRGSLGVHEVSQC